MGVVEFANGIYRCGGIIRVDERVSWYPHDVSGFSPVNSYALRDPNGMLIIDTGVAAHEDIMIRDLRRVIGGNQEVALVLTRVVEFDSQGNAAKLLETLNVSSLYTSLPAHFILPSRTREDPPFVPGLNATSLPNEESLKGIKLYPLDPSIPLGSEFGSEFSNRFSIIDPPLRLLNTAWIYDKVTGTLFTSDSFIHGLLTEDEGKKANAILRDDEAISDFRAVARVLSAKFEWLTRADTSALINELRAIFREYDVRNIAPGLGRVFVGSDRCAIERENMVRALQKVSEL
jgi:hypothetical protein